VKNINYLLVLVLALGMLLNVNAGIVQERSCGVNTDLCTWSEALPLGSPDNAGCTGLFYNTYWALNSDKTVSCSFDGSRYMDHDLFVSIDNDIMECTLNGNIVMQPTVHEGCAPVDPRNGFTADLQSNVVSGTNTLVCKVKDRGVISHFDACVVGSRPITTAPEFGSIGVAIAAMLTAPGFAYLFVRLRA
jgi:hypothetical protein